ncbi:ROK family protein [Corynebacterium mendelii]|uniref:ROK family protein n=1 Tax=Corynebacterium mendelii TaxID=2765362 RepID=UPI002ED09B5C
MTDSASPHSGTGRVAVGFDIGGTNLRGSVVDIDGTVIDTENLPTPSSLTAMDRAIARIVDKLASRNNIGAVGLAVAGFLDPSCNRVRFAPHLPWRNVEVKTRLEDLLGLPVRLEHDANAAAWGEYRFGAAQGAKIWTLFAIGTGIGGALMINGTIYRGSFGTAPEFGHVTVVPEGRPCPCGKRGCLERYCSGTALATTAKEIIASGEFPVGDSCLATRHAADSDTITGRLVMQCARRGDPVALAVFDSFAGWLGSGLSLVGDVLDPELIVIGGGVAAASDLYYDRAVDAYAAQLTGSGHRPLARIETTRLGGDAGMIGVADLARGLMA